MRSRYIVGRRSTARSRSTDQNESWRKGIARSNPSRSQADPWPLCPRCYPRPRPPDLGGGAHSNGGETAGVQLFGATTTHSLPWVGLHEGNDIANYMGSYSPGIGAARAEILGIGGRGGDTAKTQLRRGIPTVSGHQSSAPRPLAPFLRPDDTSGHGAEGTAVISARFTYTESRRRAHCNNRGRVTMRF
jgi:hypothetical protein